MINSFFKQQLLLSLIVLQMISFVSATELDDFELLDPEDIDILLKKDSSAPNAAAKNLEEIDDLESLKSDIGDVLFEENTKITKDKKDNKNKEGLSAKEKLEASSRLETKKEKANDSHFIIEDPEVVINDENSKFLKGMKNVNIKSPLKGKVEIFDVGVEEKKLLELSKFVQTKIPNKEWNEINTLSKTEKYIIQNGDTLWRISQNLFGSGFYYSKVWSLNPHITNPHEIEPGMILLFNTGSSSDIPSVKLGTFGDTNIPLSKNKNIKANFDFAEFGDATKPNWLEERKKLVEQGVFFQYASEETYDDLFDIGKQFLTTEYQKYSPPLASITITEPGEQYDSTGFDKESRIVFDVKEGFYLNTFITKNIVQDLGFIDSKKNESSFIQEFERIFVRLDDSVKVKPGDMVSVYSAAGKIGHPISDRKGFKYTTTASLKVINKINQLWECEVVELSGIVQRKDRITNYVPKINRIIKTFNTRNIEAAILDDYKGNSNGLSFGDVVYLDRGRADGVELGNVFELYSFKDLGTGRKITPDPTYKIGEVVVITITDNFSTALISNSRREINRGTLALSKTEEQAARATRLSNKSLLKSFGDVKSKALEELDVELNLDDISEDLLDKADQIQLTEDELDELERQERERSVIKDHEKDLRELERLEEEIIEAEDALNEAKLDEDKFLEQQNLEQVESGVKNPDPNAFESLDDVEKDVGRKYLDQNLNSKENPYGLTEFDLEEIDELLNTVP